jgi:hypothetical protein
MTKPTPPASLSDLANRLESARVHIILYSFKEEGKPIDTKASIVNEQLDPIIRALESQKDIREQVEADVDNLSVWCAICQKPMNLVSDPDSDIVKGWYTCGDDGHDVLISLLTPPTGATDA